ncbi:hypothetical protein [Halorussus salinus]|uniref:hypothetical protein n=1 Tax=Halorussus salinus TaxID=1364935 RepID=UPI0010931F32|nr:hypothetical protein [Halorussus salinus]
MRPESKTFLVILVGLALLFNPFVPGLHLGDGSVYRYEAASVEYHDDGSLSVTSVRTGDAIEQVSLDDEIACFDGSLRRLCRFEYHVLDGGNVSAYPESFGSARYDFVYLKQRLYRPTSVERDGDWYAALEPVNESDPLRFPAAESGISSVERRLVESGRVLTYEELPHDDQLIEVEDEYYTLYKTASRTYSSGGSRCVSSGAGFCEKAGRKRLVDSVLTVASWLAGLGFLSLARRRTVE